MEAERSHFCLLGNSTQTIKFYSLLVSDKTFVRTSLNMAESVTLNIPPTLVPPSDAPRDIPLGSIANFLTQATELLTEVITPDAVTNAPTHTAATPPTTPHSGQSGEPCQITATGPDPVAAQFLITASRTAINAVTFHMLLLQAIESAETMPRPLPPTWKGPQKKAWVMALMTQLIKVHPLLSDIDRVHYLQELRDSVPALIDSYFLVQSGAIILQQSGLCGKFCVLI